jgi:hypothetical protein
LTRLALFRDLSHLRPRRKRVIAAGICACRYYRDLDHMKGTCVIQIHRSTWEIEQVLQRRGDTRVTVTGAQLADGQVRYDIQRDGQSDTFAEPAAATLNAIRVLGARATGVDLREGSVYYTLAQLG